jgi:hypothetical protein
MRRDPDRAELALILDGLGVTGSLRNAALSLHGLDFGLWTLDRRGLFGSIQRNSKNLNFTALYPPPIF